MSERKVTPFSLTARLKSFKFALAGLRHLIVFEHNSRVHTAAAIIAVITGLLLKIDLYEWLWVSAAIALVYIAEIFNTIIEIICDHFFPEYNPTVRIVKDLGSAGVLISAAFALVVAAVVFAPRIF